MAGAPHTAHSDDTGGRLGLVATPLVVGTFASTIANTLVNVPLATIVTDLDAPLSSGALVVVAFNVLCALMLPLGGWMADRFGRRRLFLISMAVVAIGAAGAATAPNIAVLVGFRAVQGVGGALVLPSVLALLTSAAGPARRGRAVSWWAAANGAGQAAGPTVGGLVADTLGWRAVFVVIIPFALVGFAGGLRWVPPTPARPTRLDRAGVLTLTTGMGLLLVAASAVPALGVTSALVWATAAAGVLGLSAFVLVERRPDPFIPPSLLVEPRFARSAVAALCQMFCLTATLVTVPLYLTSQVGASAAVTGLVVVTLPLAMTLLAPLAGLATERWSPRRALRLGLLALGLAELGLALLIADGHGVGGPLVAAVTAIGVGIAFTQTPATAGASRNAVGAGLGLFNMLRFVGAALGGATVAVVLDSSTGGHATVAAINGAAALLALGVAFLGRNPTDAPVAVAARPPSRKDVA